MRSFVLAVVLALAAPTFAGDGAVVPAQGNQVSSPALDVLLGSTRGSIPYRGASGWTQLGPGTAGYFLQTQGAGADPVWAAVSTTHTLAQTLTDGSTTGANDITVSSGQKITGAAAADLVVNAVTGQSIVFNINGTQQAKVNASGLTGPTSGTFNLAGSATSVAVSGGGAGTDAVLQNSNTGTVTLNSAGTGSIRFQTNGSTPFTISSAGLLSGGSETLTGTLTLTGATVTGTPTWSSSQAITLSTAAQTNITSLGTLTGLTMGGTLTVGANTLSLASSTVSGTPTWSSNQAITLSTAAQTNITSLGTLTSLATGSITMTDATNIAVGTTTGTQIATGTTQKLGFFGQTPTANTLALATATAISFNNDTFITKDGGAAAGTIRVGSTNGGATGTVEASLFDAQGSTAALNGATINLSIGNVAVLSLTGAQSSGLSGTQSLYNLKGPNSSSVTYGILRNSVSIGTGSATTNLSTAVPALSVVYAVAIRVTTGAGTAVTANLEDAGGSFYGGTWAINTTNTTFTFGGNPTTTSGGTTLAPNYYGSSNTFKIVSNTTPSGAGVVEVIIYYYTIAAPVS